MSEFEVTAAKVKALREKVPCGIIQAAKALKKAEGNLLVAEGMIHHGHLSYMGSALRGELLMLRAINFALQHDLAGTTQWLFDRDRRIAERAEKYGAKVAYANDPAEFEHQITFTPNQLRGFIQRESEE